MNSYQIHNFSDQIVNGNTLLGNLCPLQKPKPKLTYIIINITITQNIVW